MSNTDYYTASTYIVCILFVIVFGLFITVWCHICIKKRKRNIHTLFPESPVVVTAATHQTNTAPRSYPVSQVPVAGTVNAGYQAQIYAAPYPTQNFPTQMPMPMPMPTNQTAPPPGVHPHIAPVLAMPAAASMHPPPYDVAVAGGPPMPGVTAYEKQSAYNPNFAN
ncbi:uncharacterized protein ACN427_001672 isoform 1-T1 [Glossina fuscipes fuscipes]